MAQTRPDTFRAPAQHEAEQLLHLARLIHAGASSGASDALSGQALTPVQWTALRYFARANRFSRTPSAFSDFNGTTRGTASQVVKSLIGMGLLARHVNKADARSALIEVTPAGLARLRDDPTSQLGAAIEALEPPLRAALAEGLQRLTTQLARSKGAPIFGHCQECRHCEAEPEAAFCHCTQSWLDRSEMGALCVDFAPAGLSATALNPRGGRA